MSVSDAVTHSISADAGGNVGHDGTLTPTDNLSTSSGGEFNGRLSSISSTDDLPLPSTTLLQVRTGKARPILGTTIKSGIYKSSHTTAVKVTKLGFEGDEHVYEFHGGLEKAVHHYSSLHYAKWRNEIPGSAKHFHPGAFGENIVSDCFHEGNLCVGDVVRVGGEGGVVLQVTEPRQPCFKLNHRFEHREMSAKSQESGRTGWYYRVLQEGFIQPGDGMVVVERPNPEWTLADVQRYLYKDMRNEQKMRELVALPFLGEEPRGIFRRRLEKNFEDQQRRLVGGEERKVKGEKWMDFKLTKKTQETVNIASFHFEALEPTGEAEPVKPGTHVRIRLGDSQLTRAFSVVSGTSHAFFIGVALAADSRGGSKYLHKIAQVGDVLQTSKLIQSFPLAAEAKTHCFVAGGIGITAFIAAATDLSERGLGDRFEFHLAVRSAADISFKRHLVALGASVRIYDKSKGERLDLDALLKSQVSTTHVYSCGPPRLMDGVASTCKTLGWDEERVHSETFSIATAGDPFSAQLKSSGRVLEVKEEQTLLDVLRSAGIGVASACEAGHCGSCVVGVLEGRVEHRGTGLGEEGEGGKMLSCVSRGIGRILLDF